MSSPKMISIQSSKNTIRATHRSPDRDRPPESGRSGLGAGREGLKREGALLYAKFKDIVAGVRRHGAKRGCLRSAQYPFTPI